MILRRVAPRIPWRIATAVAVVLAVGGCTGAPSASANTTDVAVTLADYSIQANLASVPAGQVKLDITNGASQVHELEVYSLPDGVDVNSIPVSGNVALTDAVGMVAVDEVEDIVPQGTPTLSLTLAPGRYAFICNLPAHYGLGMRMVLTVH